MSLIRLFNGWASAVPASRRNGNDPCPTFYGAEQGPLPCVYVS